MATKRDKTGLTAKQRKIAETLVNPDFSGTVTSLCAQYNVARSTLYRWLEKAEFRNYLEGLVNQYANSELATVWKALIRRCAIGDVQAIRLYFDLRDRAHGVHDSGVKIVDDIPE
ncbi:phBC6A51 family helix-turn-helix protein [Allofournierella sp.]|uniref:phBC6A51 family helix-turn-helix protein n=1 Tax=Allofournierella sp. TaxID=1940256 RepID=UPI003AF7AF9F